MDIRTKAILIILLTFTLGIITGFFIHDYLLEQKFRPMDRMPFSLSQRLDEILDLSTGQREKINPIIKKYDDEVHSTIEKDMTLGRSIMDSMSVEIKPFLTDKQVLLLGNEIDHFKNPPPPMPENPPPPWPMPENYHH
jgi:hypothetical protein